MVSNEFGILIQGKVSSWTNDIVNEYKKNFPDAEIVFSAWKDEDVGGINCKVVQSEKPSPTYPHSSNINLQIIGSRAGLKAMNSEVILKCRSDIFIHNKNIFKIFKENCPSEKIMAPDIGSYPFEYRITDFCLLGTKKVLSDFWNNLEFYDGSYPIAPETYLTKNYIVNVKKDKLPWKEIMHKYFYIIDFHLDFQIEWEKLSTDDDFVNQMRKLNYGRSIDRNEVMKKLETSLKK
jgi:hypothetical protein